jgi:hypothetical protein
MERACELFNVGWRLSYRGWLEIAILPEFSARLKLAMARTVRVAALVAILLGSSSGVFALCMYEGKLYAKTTLDREFRDASLVVRGEVLSSQDISAPDPDGDVGGLYRVRIDQSFKGRPPSVIAYYSPRNSGGFYLVVGDQYLLFLDPISSVWEKTAPGVFVVNYSCGQSRAWAEVPSGDCERLRALAAKVPARP